MGNHYGNLWVVALFLYILWTLPLLLAVAGLTCLCLGRWWAGGILIFLAGLGAYLIFWRWR